MNASDAALLLRIPGLYPQDKESWLYGPRPVYRVTKTFIRLVMAGACVLLATGARTDPIRSAFAIDYAAQSAS
jgi:hypothetical protein